MPLADGTRVGVFEILTPLGEGGMREVPESRRIPQCSNILEPHPDLRPLRKGFELPMTRVASSS